MRALANLSAAVLLLGLSGCMSTSPTWDARFGEAVRVVVAQQVIDPAASSRVGPVSGVDGKAAQAAMSEYVNSFVQPQAQMQSSTPIFGDEQ